MTKACGGACGWACEGCYGLRLGEEPFGVRGEGPATRGEVLCLAIEKLHGPRWGSGSVGARGIGGWQRLRRALCGYRECGQLV
jgi:hypothetical protein